VRQTEDWLAGLKRANGSLFSPTSVNNFRSRIHSRQACGVRRNEEGQVKYSKGDAFFITLLQFVVLLSPPS
jgi:hypothetical protein